MSRFSRRNRHSKLASPHLGIEFAADGVAIIALQNLGQSKPSLAHCAWLESRSTESGVASTAAHIRENLEANSIRPKLCTLTLSPQHYQLHRMSRPQVPASELRQAVRWQLRDLVDYPITDAIVDVFSAGAEGSADADNDIYVVTAQQQVLSPLVECIERANLTLDAIEIPELGHTRLLCRLAHDAPSHLQSILHVNGQRGLLTICQNESFQIGREFRSSQDAANSIKILRKTLASAAEQLADKQTVESVSGHGTLWCLPNVASNSCWASIANDPQLNSQVFSFDDVLEIQNAESQEIQAKCLVALTAALRSAA